ncbi:23S rRNA (pseudouridine(1915)-N(3))-methyltransferase RlmH [soil metagenome]
MKITLICVGRRGGLLDAAITEYESRAGRYWSLEVVEVKEERARKGMTEDQVRDAEGERILKRVSRGAELVALTRRGDAWSSVRFARHLERHTVDGGANVVYVIGGAFGLSDGIIRESKRRMRLSTLTMPHDLARLVLLEQLYRAGTIIRNEPYHKGDDE